MKCYSWFSIVIFLVVVVFPNFSEAKMYKWKDENGVLHFSDTPPEIAAQAPTVYETAASSATGSMQSLLSANPDDKIEFRDDFEYEGSPTEHGWKFGFGGNDNLIFTAADMAHSGTRSLKGQLASPLNKSKRFGLHYDLRQNEIGTDLSPGDEVEIVIYWYDDGVSKGDANFHPGLDYKRPDGLSASVSFSDNSRGEYSIRKSGSPGWTYFGKRTSGWHEIRFFVRNNYLDVYFDGAPISKNHDQVSSLRRIKWYTNILAPGQTTLSRIDNVRITRHINR